MTWRNDGHGLLFRCGELKLYRPSHTWGMKLSGLSQQTGRVRVLTYSLPDLAYVLEQFRRRPHDVWLIGHTKFRSRAEWLQRAIPGLHIGTAKVHSKVVLIAPATVYIGSANFGRSNLHETVIAVRSSLAHDWLAEEFDSIWRRADIVPDSSAAA